MALHTLPIWLPLLLIIPLLLLLRKIRQVKSQDKQLLPPGPPRLPLLGNLHQLGALPHQSLRKLSAKYGPVMLFKLGRVPVVVISSAEAAHDVLKVHDLDCYSRPQLTGTGKLSYNYSYVAFAPYGKYWRERRTVCVLELFSVKRVQSFGFVREEEVASLMYSISESSASATPVDLSEKIYELTGSIIFRIAFGKRFDESKFDDSRFKKLIHSAEAMAGSFTAEECFTYIGWIIDRLTGYYGKLDRIFHELDSFLQQIIDDHLKPERKNQDQEDIIDVLLKIERDRAHQSGPEAQLTKDHIKAILMNIFLAGGGTSAITVVWEMTELIRNPRLMHKAQDEVRNCVGNKGRVTESDLDQLQFLKMIVKETLRLHPPGPMLLPRESISHFKVNGYNIYPKTVIQVNAWAIGRDPSYWEKPEEFFPERFMDNSIDLRGQQFELLPFGTGRRGCPGMHMGLSVVELALANLLYCFDWKLPDGMKDIDIEETCGMSITVCKKTPLSLLPVKYLQ